MANLYELTGAYARMAAIDYDPETGEVDPFAAELKALEGDINTKIDGCARVCKQLDADMAMLKVEEARLSMRRKSIERNKKRLRTYMSACMQLAKIDSLKTLMFTVSLAAAKDKVLITDEKALPKEFLAEAKPPPPDKKAIMVALSKGQEVPGAELEEADRVLTIR
jgi:hypothetical protein